MTATTGYLLLGPLVLFAPLYALRGLKRWGALLAAVGLALEAFACIRLPADAGVALLGQTLVLDDAARMALAWASGASAVLALAAALLPDYASFAPFLLPAMAGAGAALAVEPGPTSLVALGLVFPLAVWLFQATGARVGRGASRAVAMGAVGLCAFAVSDVLLARALTAEVEQTPPWAALGTLAVVGAAAYLGLFPFWAWVRGMADAGQPLAAGWMMGVLQPIVLVGLARACVRYPELLASAQARQMAVAVAAVGVVVGAAFAVASNRPSRTLAYTALVGMSVLALRLFGADGRASGAFWFAAAAYSASVALAAIALASVEGGSARRLDEWAGAAREHAAGIAPLAVAALGLCGLPAGVGFWVHAPLGAPLAPVPAWVGLVARAAPLVASLGWGRVLWVSVHPSLAPHAQCGRLARAYLWALVAAGVGLFLWPSLLMRLGETFATALGSL